jgi:uncharacterized protein (DUF2236 family)
VRARACAAVVAEVWAEIENPGRRTGTLIFFGPPGAPFPRAASTPAARAQRILMISATNAKRAVLLAGSLVYTADVLHVHNFISTYYEDGALADAAADEQLVQEFLEQGQRLVSHEQFSKCLGELKQELVPGYGLFEGPEDPALKLFRELIVGFGGIRAVLLQIAHPYVAKAILMHSNVALDPYERAVKTQNFTFGMLYGSREEIIKASLAVRALHNPVKGALSDASGAFGSGASYNAAQAHALQLVAFTMPESIVFAFEMVRAPCTRCCAIAHKLILLPRVTQLDRRLTTVEKDALVRVNLRFQKCFGLSSPAFPQTWKAYSRLYGAILRSPSLLNVTPTTRTLVDALFVPPLKVLDPLIWVFKWMTFVQMPPRLREAYYRKLAWYDLVLFSLLVAQNRFLHRVLVWLFPPWVRFVPAYGRLMDHTTPGHRSGLAAVLAEQMAWLGDVALRQLLPKRDKAAMDKRLAPPREPHKSLP